MNDQEIEKKYGGIGRLAYVSLFAALAAVIVIVTVVGRQIDFQGNLLAVNLLALTLLIAGYIVLPMLRLNNCGYPGWYVLGFLIPFLNLWVATICLAAPAGYADHKKLDLPGKIIVGSIVALFILVLLSALLEGLAR